MRRSCRPPWQPEQLPWSPPPFLHMARQMPVDSDRVIGDTDHVRNKVEPQPNEGGSVIGNRTWNRVSPGLETTRKSPPCRWVITR